MKNQCVEEYNQAFNDGAEWAIKRIKEKVENLKNFSDEKGLCHSYNLVIEELARMSGVLEKNENVL